MRAFIIALSFILVFGCAWGIYYDYSDEKLHDMISEIDDGILESVENAHWEEASYRFNLLSKKWHKYRNTAYYFFDNSDINETDYTLARAKYYIKSKDVSNASGELCSLREQMKFLHVNERLTVWNIL